MQSKISVFHLVRDNLRRLGGAIAQKPPFQTPKLAILSVLGNLVLLCSPAFGQATQNTTIQPDCLIPFTYPFPSSSANFPVTPTNGGAGDNRTKGCAAWTMMYQNTGFTAVTVTLQSGSSPTTTVSFGSFAGTISTGFVNPIVSDTGGSLQAVNGTADISWVQIHVAATGTGTLTGVLYGFRNSSAAVNGGGGGGGSCPSGANGEFQYTDGTNCQPTTNVTYNNLSAAGDIVMTALTPHILGTLSAGTGVFNGPQSNVLYDGGYCYFGNDSGAPVFVVLDCSTNTPKFVAGLTPSGMGTINALAKQGPYIYAAGFNSGAQNPNFVVIDVSNPKVPVLVASLNDNDHFNYTFSMIDAGNYLFLAEGADGTCGMTGCGVTVVDIHDHLHPFVADYLQDGTNLPAPYQLVRMGPSVLTVLDFSGQRITTLDIRNPISPVVLGTLEDTTNFGNDFTYIDSRGDTLFAATSDGTNTWVSAYDLSTPASPVFISKSSTFVGFLSTGQAQVSGNMFYIELFASNKIGSVDITNPAAMLVNGFLTDATNLNGPDGIGVFGNRLFAANGNIFGGASGVGFSILDISSQYIPSLRVGTFQADTVLVNQSAKVNGTLDAGGGFSSGPGGSNSTGPTTGTRVQVTGNVVNPITAVKNSQSATAPGSAVCDLRWVAGTNMGTGKLVAACGTSATEVTIVDNVGTSF